MARLPAAVASVLCSVGLIAGAHGAAPKAPPLPAAVLSVLKGSGLPVGSFGVYARTVDTDADTDAVRPLVALNAERAYTLASTTKLVTSLAALDLLGPRYRWHTHAFLTGPVVNGRLLGDLVIVGGGNAHLSSDELRSWFARMREQGLDEVWGDIVLDRLAFRLSADDHTHTPPPGADRPHHAWPDALTLDAGVLRVGVRPGTAGAAEVTMQPRLADVRLVNRVVMRRGAACRAVARWSDAPARRGHPTELTVRGQWSERCGAREIATFMPLSHPAFTTRAVAGLWRDAGGRLLGRAVDRARPDGESPLPLGADGAPLAPWSTHRSPPLPELIREINKTSNNMLARTLMLTLARGFPLRAATLADARERVAEWLRRQGLADGDIELDNGSGLARSERGKPRALAQLLARAWRAPGAGDFVDSLPVAGVDGTLAHRLQRGNATGRAHLKTGTLSDTRALAGYVRARSGKVYAVAAVVNHPQAERATPALDALIEWVAKNG